MKKAIQKILGSTPTTPQEVDKKVLEEINFLQRNERAIAAILLETQKKKISREIPTIKTL